MSTFLHLVATFFTCAFDVFWPFLAIALPLGLLLAITSVPED